MKITTTNPLSNAKCQSIVFSTLLLLTAGAVGAEPNTKPIVDTAPIAGHFVQVPSGYMVPHNVTIPGTDVSFQMIPVLGSASGKIPPFWIGKCEVTFREYQEYASLYGAFQENHPKQIPESRRVDVVSAPTPVYNPRDRFEGVDSLDCPAYSMTLFAAKQYTKWLSLITSTPYRLPTEAEWEIACGAGGSGYFSKTEQLRRQAVFDFETDNVVQVASREPNAWGIYDMQGNVSEWVITQFPEKPSHGQGQNESAELKVWPPLWISKGGHFASPLEDCLPSRRFVVTEEEWEGEANYPRSTTWLGSYSDRVRIGFRVVRQLGELDKVQMAKYWDAETRSYRHLIDMKLREGRGAEGVVDPGLPAVRKQASDRPLQWEIP